MLRVENLRRTHAGQTVAAVRDVSFEVARGEVVVVVGPSGCGKSSVLRMIAGLDAADSGRVSIADRDMADVSPDKRDVAMVFQGYALYPHMTARENMTFPLRMRGTPKSERAAIVDRAAKLLAIEHLLDRRPDQLSGGERQRVAMGRAIVRSPRVFLFDEPLSNLDAALRGTLRVELATLLRELDATAIYVTHDQIEAMTIGHRVVVMRDGRIEQIGVPAEVYEDPATSFVASFLGSPRINSVEITRGEDGPRIFGAPIAAPAASVTAAIRPEHFAITSAEHALRLSIDAVIELVEPLGGETILHCEAGSAKLRIREPGLSRRERGSRIALRVDPACVLFFDATGARVRGVVA